MTAQKKKYDVGILGWWYGKNYGSIMTYYGLNRAIEGLGFRTLMVHEALGYNGYRVAWPNNILSMEFARRVGYQYTEQMHFSKLPALNDEVSTFVVGSDQLWNPVIGRVNDDLFLDFVSPENRRVAYATSFGNRGIAKFKPEFVDKQVINLQKFNAISVRESYAVATARDVFGVEAAQVVDPVFLLNRDAYDQLAARASARVSGDYLAVFFLDPTPEKRVVAEAIADKLGLEKIVVIPNPDGGRKLASEIFTGNRFEIMPEDMPENFLWVYSQSRYVVTDSFHGSAFAVIFGKPFSSIYNTHRGADRFKSLMSALGFGESRRVFETDTPETIAQNVNVSLEIDFTKANRYLETEREASLLWLKSALMDGHLMKAAPGTSADGTPQRGGILGKLKDKYRNLLPSKAQSRVDSPDQLDCPDFFSNNAAWRISKLKASTNLTVAPGAAVRGNLVWCDLPFELLKEAAYRLTIRWKVRSTGGAVNLHVRNPKTGKFRVIGTVQVRGRSGVLRSDTVDFLMPEEGFGQLMLGAVHFSGDNGGAEVESIAIVEIPVSAMTAKPEAKAPTHSEVSLRLALDDNDRFVAAHAKSMSSRDGSGARARMMFHAHALEKGLSRSDFRGGFGKISVPGLAKEMNSWLANNRDPGDQFFRIAASVMNSYFDRHKRLNVDVSEYRGLFSDQAKAIIDHAVDLQGGVIAAAAKREEKVLANQDRTFLDVIYGRRSVREFTSQRVENADIACAVQIALQAPSVCNRQAARVHQFEDHATIKAALEVQGGFGGYKMPPKLLLVTSDLNAFLFAAERNQPFVDGGLFMMTLLLGLEHMGLGTCSLNTAMNTERENTLRKLLGIPDHEVFISFIAVGHFDPAILTPRSKRIAFDEVLIRHG